MNAGSFHHHGGKIRTMLSVCEITRKGTSLLDPADDTTRRHHRPATIQYHPHQHDSWGPHRLHDRSLRWRALSTSPRRQPNQELSNPLRQRGRHHTLHHYLLVA